MSSAIETKAGVYLQHPEGPDGRERVNYLTEIEREVGFVPLTAERVRELDCFYGGEDPRYRKLIYSNRPFIDLVAHGEDGLPTFKFAERSYHEATWGPISDSIAFEAKDLLTRLSQGGMSPTAIELNTGPGSITYSLCQAGFSLKHTVERNYTIHTWAQENLRKLGVNGGIGWVMADAWSFVSDVTAHGGRFDVAIADPPWRRGLHYRRSQRFGFADMKPDGRKIVPHLLQVAPVVGIKAPEGLSDEEIASLAGSLGAGLVILHHHLTMGRRTLREKFAFFVSHAMSAGQLETKEVELHLNENH